MPPAANEAAVRFGRLVRDLAIRAGYDLTQGGTGRTRLAEDAEMSIHAVGRMLRGESLPEPAAYQRIARAVGVPARTLLAEVGILSDEDEHNPSNRAVRSVTDPPPPEAIADLYGITQPVIRETLIANIEQAIRLQHDVDHGSDGGAAARR